MSFFFFLGSAELHFDAETVYKKEIPDETFERKDKFVQSFEGGYRQVY